MTKPRFATRIETKRITDLKLLDVNARFMRHETFAQLVENIKRDGKLTSVPFVARNDDGTYEVLSGNHRVMAAKEAGIDEIEVMLTDDVLTKDEKVAIQLSHNAIAGEDDPVLLKELYESIENLDLKLYSGIDDHLLGLFPSADVDSLSTPSLAFQSVSLLFLPNEVEDVKAAFAEALELVPGKEILLARWKDYDEYANAIATTMRSHDVLNVATAFEIILRVFRKHITSLRDGWIQEQDEKQRVVANWVPLVTLFGNDAVPDKDARTIIQAVDKMVASGAVEKDEQVKAIAQWARAYLSQS